MKYFCDKCNKIEDTKNNFIFFGPGIKQEDVLCKNCMMSLEKIMKKEIYILNRDCYNIDKEIGDYYSGEYGESPEKIADLLKKGIIINEKDLK